MRLTLSCPHGPIRGAALLLLLGFAPLCPAGEFYYLVMFGAQRVPNEPKYAHTFATFVKVVDRGPGSSMQLESHTISWLPTTLDIRVRTLLPEEGYNFELIPTLRWVLDNGARVSRWGPYRIDEELYCKALAQIARLESGKVKYKAVDSGYPTTFVSNCIHAVSDVLARLPKLRVASPGWGEVASYLVLVGYRRHILDDHQVYPWVAEALGLREYPLINRDRDRPGPGLRRLQFPGEGGRRPSFSGQDRRGQPGPQSRTVTPAAP